MNEPAHWSTPSGTPPPSLADRGVPLGIVGVLLLLVYGAWWSTQPTPTRAELRDDAGAYGWNQLCATCHGPDGLGVSGRGGDVTRTAPDAEALRSLLDGPAHPRAREALSARRLEQVAEHVRSMASP